MAEPESAGDEQQKSIKYIIDYIKSPSYRTIPSNGAWGSVTPNGQMHLAFWNAREPIPQQIELTFSEAGELQDQNVIKRADAVREIEVGVLLDVDVAADLVELLTDYINESTETPESSETDQVHDDSGNGN